MLIPRRGERRAALTGLTLGSLGFFGYAIAKATWMMYMFMPIFAFAGLVYPSINGLMSQQVSERSQGELQGGVASVYSLSTIIGPPFMTQVFRFFTRADVTTVVAGAPFYAAAFLGVTALWMFTRATRRDHALAGTAVSSASPSGS